jgi:hypothetical protein
MTEIHPADQAREILENVLKAANEGKSVFTSQGHEVIIVKVKDGRAKVKRQQDGLTLQAWVPLSHLKA